MPSSGRRAYLLILSARANHSSFVKNELNRAFSCGKPIVTFRIEDVLPGRSLELYLARHHWTDAFPPPLEPRVDQLASSLTRLLNPSAEGSVEASPVAVVSQPTHPRVPISKAAGISPLALPPSRNALRAWMMVAAVAVLGMIAFAIPALRHLRESPPPLSPETRTDIVTPATGGSTSFALSPDGKQIVFVATGDGATRLWLRSLTTTTTQPLAGTEGAKLPFWSPDSRSIGFFDGLALKRLDLGGGVPQTLAPVVNGQGGTWNAEGVIVFAPSLLTPLMRVPAAGGAVKAVTTLGPQQRSHLQPWFLPDGRRFLFRSGGAPDERGIYLGSLDGTAPARLTNGDSLGGYLPSGWLLWVEAGALLAQRLDIERAALIGDPVTVAGDIDPVFSQSPVSLAPHGLVAYRAGAGSQRQLTWVDRSGTARGAVGEPDGSNLRDPRVSPDGRRVVVARTVQGNTDLWLADGTRLSRFTFDAEADQFPIWSPDGTRIAYQSTKTGASATYQKLASGMGAEERLLSSDQITLPNSWSVDGRYLLFVSVDPQTNADFWVKPMVGDGKASVILKTRFRETSGSLSPDGRWMAYHSNESGRMEIYVRPFVPPGAASADAGAGGIQWQVSTMGGVFPAWRPDGKELYYVNPAGEMMAVQITVDGGTLAPGASTVLFPTRIYRGGVDNIQGRQYDIAPDGRFLINTVLDSAEAPITLIQNWNPEAEKSREP